VWFEHMPLLSQQGEQKDKLPIPSKVEESITKCKELLVAHRDRGRNRLEFLEAAAAHIRDVIVPAMNEFSGQFPMDTFTIDKKPSHPLIASATLRYDCPSVPGIPAVSVGIKYTPSKAGETLEETAICGDNEISVGPFPLADLTRETVLSRVAATILVGLKRELTASPK
jgi:hypothetical protein